MKTLRSAFTLSVVLALLIATGCLELAGQRITLRHDAARDELHILIQYDGVHDSGNDEYGEGARQVAEAVKNGELLLMEWPFHLNPEHVKGVVTDQRPEMPQEARDFAKVVIESMSVKTIGHHRDPQGRVGGSQLVTIRNVKAFLKSANALLSALMLRPDASAPPEFAKSFELIRAAAKKNHTWLSLDGNALKWTMPVHPREWAALKARGILALADAVSRMQGGPEEERTKNQKDFLRVLGALTSAAIAYSDADGMLSVRIGDVEGNSTIRLDTGKEYRPNIEEAVTKAAAHDIDESMLKLMLGEKVEKDAQLVGEIMKWGPPEEKVRGLIRSVKANDAKLAAKAVKRLEVFAEQWNEKEAFPPAPKPLADTEEYVEAWKKWYAAMLRFPLPADLEAR